jgi:hypothetical protein
LNEFLEWVRKNAGPLIAGAAGLLILSVLAGFVIGHARRDGYGSVRPQSGEVKAESQARNGIETPNPRTLPKPVVPGFDEGVPSYSFILDRADAVLMDMEPVPLKISDLVEHRAADVQSDVKPFVFNNEEFDVLVKTDELAEP